MPEQHRPFADHPCAAAHPGLIRQAQSLLALAIAPSTRRTYSSGIRSCIGFVDAHNIRPAFPASVQTICLWVAFLASPPHAVTLGTCNVYLSAVITRHTEMGFAHPLADAPPMLERIMTGIKRLAGQPAKPKLPITTALLEATITTFPDDLCPTLERTSMMGQIASPSTTPHVGLRTREGKGVGHDHCQHRSLQTRSRDRRLRNTIPPHSRVDRTDIPLNCPSHSTIYGCMGGG